MEKPLYTRKNKIVFFKSIKRTIIEVLGMTFGIWFSLFFVNLFYNDMLEIDSLTLNQFINNGSFLLLTFSILTTLLVKSTKGFKINLFNSLALVGIILVGIYYAKLIGLNNGVLDISESSNKIIYLRILPFISSLILLLIFYFVNGIKNKSLWLNGAKEGSATWNVFLSFAIAGSKSKASRLITQNEVKQLQASLENLGYNPIFNASDFYSSEHDYQPPQIAAKTDFQAIENCKNFLLYYPEKVPSSALVELGYAIRDRDNIVIISKNRNTLPFLVRELDAIHPNIKIISDFNDFEHVNQMIIDNHKEYFK